MSFTVTPSSDWLAATRLCRRARWVVAGDGASLVASLDASMEGRATLSCLFDRSSRPRRSPRQLRPELEAVICECRRRTGWGPRLVAGATGFAHSTVWKLLRRAGISRPPQRPKEAANSYEWPCPGDLLHMDTSRYARFLRPGHRVTGDRSQALPGRRVETRIGRLVRVGGHFAVQGRWRAGPDRARPRGRRPQDPRRRGQLGRAVPASYASAQAQGGPVSLSVDPRIGSELFGYRLEALLGRGGMGVVYKAYDPRLKRYVALKLIAPELSEDERFRDRFLAETELAASLEHPNVVPIHDAGEVEGQLYLAMRYVEGGELKTLLEKEGALEPARAVAMCGQTAAALDAAHARGLVHRDVKPSNVLLDENEHVYLADFGLSRRLADPGGHGEAGFSVGTPAYAAPEQIEGGDADGRADVYSLGCLMFECLTGQPPFKRDSELAVLWAHVQEPPPNASEHNGPELPVEIDPVLAKAMAKDPDDRYSSCGGLVVAAREALGVHPRGWMRRRKMLVLGALAAPLIAAAVLVPVFLNRGTSGPRRPSSTPTLTPKVDSVQRVDPKTNKLVATIPAGAGADGIAAGDGAVFVASSDDRSVSRIDPATNAVVRRTAIDAPRPPRSVALGPQYPNGRGSVLWVVSAASTLSQGGQPCSLSQLDARTLAKHFTTSFDGGACGPVASRDGTTWFGGSYVSLVLVAPDSGQALRTVPTGGYVSGPDSGHGLAVGNGAVWLASPFTEELVRFDGRGKRAIPTGSGSFPSDVAVGEGGVWVADSLHNTVIEVDPSRNRIVRTIPVGVDPIAVATGAGAVWVANDQGGTVSRIDPGTGRVTTFRVGPHPRNLAVGEGAIWVTVHPL
jgi:serine/threonine protein kinase/streptogramin lyase